MTDVKQVRYEVTGADKGAVSTFSKVKGAIGEVERSYAGLAKMMAGGLAVGAVGTVFGKMISEVRDAERETQRLNAIIRATGNTAGFTRQQLGAMADALNAGTSFEHGDITDATTNLLKFQNIHGEVFREAMQLTADYAALTGTNMVSASQAVGRALQSPVTGLRNLQQELGRMTPEQERHIKLLMEQGRLAEAQAQVLDYLRGKLAGTAAEMNQGLNGAIANVSKNWKDMLEKLGSAGPGEIAANSMNNIAIMLRRVGEVFDGGLMNNIREYSAFLMRLNGIYVPGHPGSGPVRTDAGWGGSPGIGGKAPLTEEQIEAAKRAEDARLRALKEAADLQKRWAAEASRDAERLAEQQMRYLGAQWAERQKLIEAAQEAEYHSMDIRFEAEQELQRQIGQMALRQYHDREKKLQQADEEIRKFKLEADKRAWEEANQFAIQAARNLQSEMAGAVYDVLDRRTDSLGDRFSQVLKRMQAELIASNLNKLLLGNFGASGDIGGLIGAGLGRLFNNGAPTLGWNAGSPMGAMPAAPVPQLSTGTPFVPRDMLALVHRGERIEPAYRNKPDNNARSPVIIQGGIRIYAQDLDSFRGSEGQVAAQVSRVLSRAKRYT